MDHSSNRHNLLVYMGRCSLQNCTIHKNNQGRVKMHYLLLLIFILEIVFISMLITFVDISVRIRKYSMVVDQKERSLLRSRIVWLASASLLLPIIAYLLLE